MIFILFSWFFCLSTVLVFNLPHANEYRAHHCERIHTSLIFRNGAWQIGHETNAKKDDEDDGINDENVVQKKTDNVHNSLSFRPKMEPHSGERKKKLIYFMDLSCCRPSQPFAHIPTGTRNIYRMRWLTLVVTKRKQGQCKVSKEKKKEEKKKM